MQKNTPSTIMFVIQKHVSMLNGCCFELEEKKMKRMLAIVLVLCMVLSLCACGGSGDKAAASGEKKAAAPKAKKTAKTDKTEE